jgi:replicative DNA helicase
MRSDTSHIETRLFAEALETGEHWDLTPEDFSVEEFGLLWGFLQTVRAEYGACDHVLLGDWLESRHGLDKRAWLEAVHSNRMGKPDLMPAYAQALRNARHSDTLARTLAGLAHMTGDPANVREDALAALNNLPISGRYRSQTINEAIRATVAEMDRRHDDDSLPGVPTGFPTLDSLTGGWHKSDLILVGARPAAGKTALMVNLVMTAARAGKSVGIISAEQPAQQIAQRLLSLVSSVPAWKLRNPRKITDAEWHDITKAVGILRAMPIQIFDASAPDMAAVRIAAKGFGADVLFVDYVQRLKGRGEAIYDRVSSIAQGLKELARDLDTPVVALAQINRAGATNATMAHLKGSGDLEQEADMVLILERQDNAEVATLDLAKNRHGATGGIDLLFRSETMFFGEMQK